MRVLTVDDEPIMRKAYQSLIEWEKNGFEFAGSAKNGQEALDIMREKPVDIVITDLKMPVVSGLELIKISRSEFPNTKFVVMSGFEEFHLVKEAFTLGAKEYFLKIEMDPDEILRVLFKLRDEIEKDSKISVKQEPNKKEIYEEKATYYSPAAYREKLLKELIWGADVSQTIKRLNENGVELTESLLSVLVISLPDYYEKEQKNWKGEREIFKYAILNVLEEICSKYAKIYVFCNLPHEFVFLISADLPERNIDVDNLFHTIKTVLFNCFEIICNGGYSRNSNSYKELKNLYREAENACMYGFVVGNGKLVKFKNVIRKNEKLNVSDRILELKRFLKQTETKQLKNNIYKLILSADSISLEQIEDAKKIFYLYHIEMINYLKENGMAEFITENILSYDSVKNKLDLNGMNKWLLNCLKDVVEALNSRSGINKAKSYIRHHYHEQLSLGVVAEHLEISPGHLSRMFHQSKEESFTQYLLKVRMETATELLKNTNMKVYEVAEKVGYANVEQFSRMFKKVVGKSPKSFQK